MSPPVTRCYANPRGRAVAVGLRYTRHSGSTDLVSIVKPAVTIAAASLMLFAAASMAQSKDLEQRVNELEAAIDLLQERIEKLEQQQTPRRMSEAEAKAVLRKKQAEEECSAQLGPAPEFAPVLGTKVNPEYMAYLKKLRACMRDKGVL